MSFFKTKAATATLGAALLLMPVGAASAAPMAPGATALGTAAQEAMPVHEVQRRRGGGPRRGFRGGRRGGGGAGVAAGVAAGALLGGIIASQAAPAPRYYVEDPLDAEIEYCMRRFRSYDPRTMTYMGYDGRRHPCP